MILNKKIFVSIIISLLAFSFCFTGVFADKISDYEYEPGHSNLFVCNRSAEKYVALTFDDGPHKKYTAQILDILDKYNAKATFFVIGQNAKLYPDIVKETIKRGHEIGNHTYSHPDLKKLSSKEFSKELSESTKIIYEITGKTPTLFRPPAGYLNNEIVDICLKNGYKTVLWSWRQDTRDWECRSSECIVSNVLTNLRNGDVILFHDYNSKESPTPKALESILEKLSDEGYKFVTVSELMSM